MIGKFKSSNSELDRYLDSDYVSSYSPSELCNLNILNLCKSNEKTYPILSKLAHDLLTVPTSIVARSLVLV